MGKKNPKADPKEILLAALTPIFAAAVEKGVTKAVEWAFAKIGKWQADREKAKQENPINISDEMVKDLMKASLKDAKLSKSRDQARKKTS